MRKRTLTFCTLLLLSLAAMAAGRAKYVFYFIGDGMGVNHVNAAETYLAAIEGRIGISELCFSSFPYSAFVNTHSATNGVTDSAAAGTALACGHKTANGTVGMLADLTTPVSNIAEWAREAGAAVGIATSVSIDHATPAAFYAHGPYRKKTYDIGQQLVNSGNDFYGGSDFVSPDNPKAGGPDLYQQAEEKGYVIAHGHEDYQKKAQNADRMILLQTEEANRKYRYAVPYAIDRKKGDMTLADITRAAIHFLTKRQKEKDGFFIMAEGGKIDWACHANDLCFIKEVIDMDNAVKVAYEFYQQHPDETLIVVTADHETGGLVLGNKDYELHLDIAGHQRMSIENLGKELKAMHEGGGKELTWEKVRQLLAENFGFWKGVNLTDEQNSRLRKAFDNIAEGRGESIESLYQKDDELAVTVRQIQAECAGVGWQTLSHSNGYVPCFAVGVGAEQFCGRIDNTEICRKIAAAAGWTPQ